MRLRLSVLPLLCFVAVLVQAPVPTPAGAQDGPDRVAPQDRERIEALGASFARGIAAPGPERTEIAAEVFAESAIREYGLERLAGLFGRLRGDLGEVEFDNAELAEVDMGSHVSRILHVYVYSPLQEGWKDLQLRLEPAPPHRVQQLGFVASVAEPVYLPNGAISDAATLEWLDRYVSRLERDEGLSGSLLVARGETTLLERVFGAEDAAGTRPVTPATRFNLGSGNKMFTALALARLVEEGRLDFDTPLGTVLPEVLDAETRAGVTIHHLLSHTSGIADYWTPEYEAAWGDIVDLEGTLPFVERAGVDFAPGTRWAYSNSNYLLAGLVVEALTGESYFDVVRRELYEPLGMTHSGAFPDEGSEPGLADPLVRAEGGGWTRAALPGRGSSAGGGYSTARDMLGFVRGLVEGRIVSPGTLETMTRVQNEGRQAATRYGYGFILEEHEGLDSFGHGGTADGINFELRYFPAVDVAVIVFSNQDNGAFDDLRRNVIRLVSGER